MWIQIDLSMCEDKFTFIPPKTPTDGNGEDGTSISIDDISLNSTSSTIDKRVFDILSPTLPSFTNPGSYFFSLNLRFHVSSK